jgi:hypothetical protein
MTIILLRIFGFIGLAAAIVMTGPAALHLLVLRHELDLTLMWMQLASAGGVAAASLVLLGLARGLETLDLLLMTAEKTAAMIRERK